MRSITHLRMPHGVHHKHGYLRPTIEAGEGGIAMRFVQGFVEVSWPKANPPLEPVYIVPPVGTTFTVVEPIDKRLCACEPGRHKSAESAERCPNK